MYYLALAMNSVLDFSTSSSVAALDDFSPSSAAL
jgi:hypothetical protein